MKVWHWLLVAVVVIAVFIAVPAFLSVNPELKEDVGVGIAENFVNSGRDDLALSMCEWVLDDSPHSSKALSLKAKVMEENGDLEEALEIRRSVVYDNPEEASPEDWNNLAVLCMKSGYTGEAVDAYGMLEKYYENEYYTEPGDLSILNNQGLVLIKLQRYDEAIDVYNRMIDLDPDNANVWIGLGDAYMFKSLYEQGQLADLYADLGRDPSERENKYQMSSFESNRKAVEAYNKAVEIDPLSYPLVSAKIMGSYQKTVENYQDILENL